MRGGARAGYPPGSVRFTAVDCPCFVIVDRTGEPNGIDRGAGVFYHFLYDRSILPTWRDQPWI